MLSNTNLVEVVKQIAMEAVNAGEPSDIEYGTVKNVSPLSIQLDSKEILSLEFFVLTKNVKNYDTCITIEGVKKSIRVHNELAAGDKVILMKKQGGQQYVILDKIGG